MRAVAAVPVAHAGPFRCVDSSAPSPSGQLHYNTNCLNASGCLATQGARVLKAEKRIDVGWLCKQRLCSNALAESSNNLGRNRGRIANVRAVIAPVRPRETSFEDSGNGVSLRTTEVGFSPRASETGSVNARSNGTVIQTAAEGLDAAEARAGLRAAAASEYDPVILSRRVASRPFKVQNFHDVLALKLMWVT